MDSTKISAHKRQIELVCALCTGAVGEIRPGDQNSKLSSFDWRSKAGVRCVYLRDCSAAVLFYERETQNEIIPIHSSRHFTATGAGLTSAFWLFVSTDRFTKKSERADQLGNPCVGICDIGAVEFQKRLMVSVDVRPRSETIKLILAAAKVSTWQSSLSTALMPPALIRTPSALAQ
jgi:hypothetical protein